MAAEARPTRSQTTRRLLVRPVATLVVFWSGAPGLLGGCAAWLAGLTRGGRPLGGAARIAGIVGAFIALLNIVLTVGGVIVAAIAL
ncbi:hypothetical protein BL253_12990 [Pseudofrankia asymbiotica]|uniref:DUF4190 domain-containing protein n=1 Tax=Pseudofrankia asymbiotica TaxID=1834516 RepID=A0A1V2IDV3_9ACTN|nr:hypothetical protein BL253_12990 [Pseudofrankia asymbiotica]